MIREATTDDLAGIMEFAEPVWDEIQPEFPVHRGVAAATLRRLIVADHGLVTLLDDGVIFGALVADYGPALWNLGNAAVCRLRWVTPARRGRCDLPILRHFEKWAVSCGARVAGICQTGRDADAYYERLGYTPAEMMYFKAL